MNKRLAGVAINAITTYCKEKGLEIDEADYAGIITEMICFWWEGPIKMREAPIEVKADLAERIMNIINGKIN